MSQVGQKLEHRISAGQADHGSRHRVPLKSFYPQQFRGARNQKSCECGACWNELQQENYLATILTDLLRGPALAAQSLGDRVASGPVKATLPAGLVPDIPPEFDRPY
jgi:hypothetical protein